MPDKPTTDTARAVDTGPAVDTDPVGADAPKNTPDPAAPTADAPAPAPLTAEHDGGEPAPATPAAPPQPRRRSRRTGNSARPTSTPAETPTKAGRVSDTAHDRVWAALRSHTESTAADLSAASGVARSTVTKLLAAWAQDGSAAATPGATRRNARRWTAAPSDLLPAPPDTKTHPSADPNGADGAAQPPTVRRRSGRGAGNKASRNRSGTPRLAAGALHGMVGDYLTEHPGDHGPTAIGRAIGRSSGAVANALERLVTAGWAVRTNDRPRRYRNAEQTEPPVPATAADPGPGVAEAPADRSD